MFGEFPVKAALGSQLFKFSVKLYTNLDLFKWASGLMILFLQSKSHEGDIALKVIHQVSGCFCYIHLLLGISITRCCSCYHYYLILCLKLNLLSVRLFSLASTNSLEHSNKCKNYVIVFFSLGSLSKCSILLRLISHTWKHLHFFTFLLVFKTMIIFSVETLNIVTKAAKKIKDF